MAATQQLQQFSLRWNNYAQHIVTALDDLRADDELTDVTLSCDGQRLKAHKILLAACSSFFRDTFKENPCKHPIIIIKGVSFRDLEAVVTFMYNGQVNVSQDRLQTFLAAAELLQIKGLTDVNEKEETAKHQKRPLVHPPANSSQNHNNSLSHSSRSGTPDIVQRPPSPKRKRGGGDSNFSTEGTSSLSGGAFSGVNNVGSSPGTAVGGSNGGALTSGLNSCGDADDPFQPKVSIKYEDEQEDDEYDDKGNISSEDNDNSMQDLMCNVEPGSLGSFLGGSGTGVGTSGTDSSHGEDSSQDLLRPLHPSHFQLPTTILLNVDGPISPASQLKSLNTHSSFPSLPHVTPVENNSSLTSDPVNPSTVKVEVCGVPEIKNVFSLGNGAANSHRRLLSLLQSPSSGSQPSDNTNNSSTTPPTPPETGNTTNKCDICGKGFTLRTNLTAHKKLHVRGATTCKWCSKTLSTIGNLRCHIQYVHSDAPHPPRRQYTQRTGSSNNSSTDGTGRRRSLGDAGGIDSQRHRRPSEEDYRLDPMHFLSGISMEEDDEIRKPNLPIP